MNDNISSTGDIKQLKTTMDLKIVKDKLTFSEALIALKEGKYIKVPEWKGYWWLESGIINVMQHNGIATTTPWLEGTVLREDWQIVEQDLGALIDDFRSKPTQLYKDYRDFGMTPPFIVTCATCNNEAIASKTTNTNSTQK